MTEITFWFYVFVVSTALIVGDELLRRITRKPRTHIENNEYGLTYKDEEFVETNLFFLTMVSFGVSVIFTLFFYVPLSIIFSI